MNSWFLQLAKLVDPYDLKARLFPGLLVLIPGVAFVMLTWGSKHPVTASLSSLLMFCGGPYALASIVRTWGQRAQAGLYADWGGQPTTLLLRHADQRIARPTKLQYHELIGLKLLIPMPSQVEEKSDPVEADRAYEAAVNALRPLTNEKSKFPFVFKELVAYGFNRNAFGARWIGLATCSLAAVAALAKSGVLSIRAPYMHFDSLETMPLSAGLVLLLSFVLAALWLFHLTSATVHQAGISYGLRLFEALRTIPKQRRAALTAVLEK